MKLLIITIFFVLFNYITCFDCYECQNCEIPFNNQTNTVTCTGGVTQCLKVSAKLGTVYTYVTKQCGPCSNATFVFGVTYLRVDCCSGSNCNGTTHLSISQLYINYIYKRKRFWNEITSPLKNKSKEDIIENLHFLMPRQSITPLIQEFLPNEFKKQLEKRKMITQLQFHEPPLFRKNLKAEWDEMDTKSLFSSELMSTRTSYYTIRGQTSYEESLSKYFSITSSNELITQPSSPEQLSSINNSEKRSPLQFFFNSYAKSSRSSLNSEKTILDKNNSSNYIVLDMEQFHKINISNNVSKM